MIVTPDQIAQLRTADRVRGKIGSAVVWTVNVSIPAFTRACELVLHDAMPVNVVWYHHATTTNRVEIYTNTPEFFIELEQRIEDARRQR